jgi:hypothetical protein
MARNAQIVIAPNFNLDPPKKDNYIHERYLESLIRILADIDRNYNGQTRGTTIINMSFGWVNSADGSGSTVHPAHFVVFS